MNNAFGYNLVEKFIENTIEEILYKIVEPYNGDVRILYKGDTDEFYNADVEKNGIKKQRLILETYSIPVSRCYSKVLYDLLSSIINTAIADCHKGYIKKPIVIFRGCKVNCAILFYPFFCCSDTKVLRHINRVSYNTKLILFYPFFICKFNL